MDARQDAHTWSSFVAGEACCSWVDRVAMATAADTDQAVAWLESVAMRPMLESLLESVCKEKPDDLLNYAIAWMRSTYPDLAGEAAAAAEPEGAWATRGDVDATPEALMAYLKEIDATTILEATIEKAIRAQPSNVVAYVVDEFASQLGQKERGA